LSDTLDLFPDLPVVCPQAKEFARLRQPVWTENKANFICRYLALFVYITKHGTYIDGFAGPQRREMLAAWTAKLVLESEPHWFRHFHLCELTRKSFRLMETMIAEQPPIDTRGQEIRREVQIYHGDFNQKIESILNSGIDANEATFCLLDQRTFECEWATVVKLATHKPAGSNKIELFYFLAVGWLHRSLSGIRGDKAQRWWGADDWKKLRKLSQDGIVDAFIDKFQNELGYKWVKPFPIYARDEGGHVLYHMIHASDHDEAPGLMVRAYNSHVRTLPRETQHPIKWDDASCLEIT
jgi:three-Cys-motif partner protein